ncbi:MAG: 6-bladed beta-propeller, partial [Bacteroidia bacterium]|nr:6-bladed beta-propeller [Bacteroidia bacterium]
MSICLTDDQISILIILVLGLYDCTERKAINNPITTIKVCPNDKVLLTSEFTNEMEIISLDENEECYIARINKLMVYNDTIIIVDRVLSKAIYFFN